MIFQTARSYDNGLEVHQEVLGNYVIDYIEGSNKNRLIIVFDGSEPDLHLPAETRLPWGAMFFESEGFSLVGVKVREPDWYRGEDLHAFFTGEDFQDFIKQFETVCLYGNSMGGFAALAFAGAIKGAQVLATGPQSTLDPRIVPWDDRFPHGTNQNWAGGFADASKTLNEVDVAYVVYDPFFPPDSAHVDRLPKDKIMRLKAPFISHDLAPQLLEMDLLKDFFLHFIEGDLKSWFPKAIRARKQTSRYESKLLLRWMRRFYQRGDHENAKRILGTLLERDPGHQHAANVLRAINAGEEIHWKWSELGRI